MLCKADNKVLFRTKFPGGETIAKQNYFVNCHTRAPVLDEHRGTIYNIIDDFLRSECRTHQPRNFPVELFCRRHFDIIWHENGGENKMYDYTFSHEAFTTTVLLGQAWQAMYNTLESKLAKTDLTPQQAYVLWFCKYYPGPLTPAEIARMLFRKSQSVAGLLARMEREGLVKRVPKRKGHPFTEVQITAEGEKRLRDGRKVLLAATERFMSSLSEEEDEQLRKLLRKVRKNGLKELRQDIMPAPGFALGEVIRI